MNNTFLIDNIKDIQSASSRDGKERHVEVGNPESHEKARENNQGTVLIVCSYFRIVKIGIFTDNNENHELDGILSPFRKNYFWAEKVKTKSRRKPKEKVPNVATSEEWNSYYNNKSIEKAQKEEEQRQKAQKRKSAQEERAAKKVAIEEKER